jgi:anti-anti-sigma factor
VLAYDPRPLPGEAVSLLNPLQTRITMPIEFQEISDGLRRIIISGRLDIPGTAEIETRFAAFAAASNLRVVLDLTAVNFLGSIGIRSIIINAKAVKQRGGRMVLMVGDNAAVAETLESTGLGALFPILKDNAAADTAALA